MATGSNAGIVLFRVAAGPRVGFGHLVRSLALARALGLDCRFSLRGTRQAREAARRLGAHLVEMTRPGAVLRSVAPVLLVVDDRVAPQTAAWRRAARRAGIPIASIHDLGIGLGDADLVVDGTVRPPRRVHGRSCLGPAFAVLRPLHGGARRPARSSRLHVLVGLGGGPRRLLASAIARSIGSAFPELDVKVAGGFLPAAHPLGTKGSRAGRHRRQAASADISRGAGRITAVTPADFDAALARASLAVVAGGMTLYEACSLGVPSVAVAVVKSQRPTVAGFANRGAALDGGLASGRPRSEAAQAITRAVGRLIANDDLRARIARRGQLLVDGRGAGRVAAALRRLIADSVRQGSGR